MFRIILTFILVYLFSVIPFVLIFCYGNKDKIHRVGDIIDELPPFIWIPVVNTTVFILFVLGLVAHSTWKLLKLYVLWEKFRNIKLK